MKTWILVANRGGARLFGRSRVRQRIRLIKELPNPGGKLKGREVFSDRQGRSNSPMKPARHAYSDDTSLSDVAMVKFAHELADFLEKERVNKSFLELMLIAEPKFLAKLKSLLDFETRRRIVLELDKNLGSSKFRDVQDQVDTARLTRLG